MAFFGQQGFVTLIDRMGGNHINVSHFPNSNEAYIALEMGEVGHPVNVVRVHLESGEVMDDMTVSEFSKWVESQES